MSEIHVSNNAAESRFEVQQDGELARLEYQRSPGWIILAHTQVPPALEGRGIGGALARAGLEYARAEGLRVVAQCPFVQGYLKRHPEYADLTAED